MLREPFGRPLELLYAESAISWNENEVYFSIRNWIHEVPICMLPQTYLEPEAVDYFAKKEDGKDPQSAEYAGE